MCPTTPYQNEEMTLLMRGKTRLKNDIQMKIAKKM